MINLQLNTIKEPVPDFIYKGLELYSKDANDYYHQPEGLRVKIAQKYKISPEMVYLIAGIDEGIGRLIHSYGQNAYLFTPSYISYADVEKFGGKLIQIYSLQGEQFTICSDKIPDASIIFLANPNNPVGFTSRAEVMKLVKNNQHTKVVIDEAYGEFADLSMINKVQDNPNLIVLRSFSKSYGMAGNRIGFMVANSEIIKDFKKPDSLWFNVSYLSVGSASIALDHEAYYKKLREEIIIRREKFISFLKNHRFTVLTSLINAVLLKFETEKEALKLVAYLKKNDIIVSLGNGNSNIGLDNSFIRIAIGTEGQMEEVQKVLVEYKDNDQK